MGVKYSASESAQLIEAMSNNIQVANEVTDRLSSGCDHLLAALESGELMGAAYTAGKGLFTDIIIPSIKKIQLAVDDIQAELTSYKNADAQISEYGDLDLDQLKELKKRREEQLAAVKAQIKARNDFFTQVKDLVSFNWANVFSETNLLSSAQSQIESGIKDLDEKIEKLEFFVAQVSQYFTDSLEVLNLAIQGASQLNQVLVDSGGNYNVDGLDMSWAEKMKKAEIKMQKYKSDSQSDKFVQNLTEQYGFDKETSQLILEVSKKIDEKFPYLSQSEKDQLLLVTLGNFIYSEGYDSGSTIGDKVKGYISDWSWMDVAGLPSDITGLPVDEKILLKHLGLNDQQIAKLRYNIRLQSQISSGLYSDYDGLDDKQEESFKSSYEEIYGVQLTDAEFEEKWNEKYNSFSGKGDFAHFSITTSANLNDKIRGSDLTKGGHEKVNDFAGWLGDATLTDGKEISFGNDDYQADLDAVNITQKMKEENLSYLEASNKYYAEMRRGEYTRAEKFTEYKSVDEIKEAIFKELVPLVFADDEELAMQYLQEKSPDTYNFIRNIEEGNHKLEGRR